MCLPTIHSLPPPPHGKTGWPWTVESHSQSEVMQCNPSLPRISIVTPSFNQARFVEETIRSIILGGYPNIEYVIIDGGSADGSVDIIRKYEPWITHWEGEPDGGQSEAINKGFLRCSGDIITFCNSDDYYYPGIFADVADAFMQNSDCGAIIGGFVFVDENSQRISEPVLPYIGVTTPYDFTLGPPGVYRLHQAATFFTRHALDSVGRYVRTDLNYVMDRELLYRIARNYPVIKRPKLYAAFRKHIGSKSVSHILPFAKEFSRLYTESQTGDERLDKERRRMARYHIANGHLSVAKAMDNRSVGLRHIATALLYWPPYLRSWAFYDALAKTLGLMA